MGPTILKSRAFGVHLEHPPETRTKPVLYLISLIHSEHNPKLWLSRRKFLPTDSGCWECTINTSTPRQELGKLALGYMLASPFLVKASRSKLAPLVWRFGRAYCGCSRGKRWRLQTGGWSGAGPAVGLNSGNSLSCLVLYSAAWICWRV